MTRKIKIVTTVGISGTIETDVTTLGDLKPLLAAQDISYSGMKLLIGQTKNELSEDVAILPEGDFKLYLVPSKTKSGASFYTKDDIYSKLMGFEDALIRIEDKLNILFGSGRPNPVKPVQELTEEDKADLDDLKSLLSSEDWG